MAVAAEHVAFDPQRYAGLDPHGGLLPTLWRLVPGQRSVYLRGIGWKILDGACSAWPALVVVAIVLELFRTPIDTGRIWMYVALLALLFVGQIVFNYLAQRAMLQVVAGMHYDLRLYLADYLRRLPLGFFSRRDTGTVDALFTTNIQFLDVRFPTDMFISGVVAPILLFVAMLVLDWRLALIAGVGLPLAFVVLHLIGRVFAQVWEAQRAARTRANSRMVEYIQGIAVIRAFNLGGARWGQFARAMDQYRAASARTQTKLTPALVALGTTLELGFAALIAVGGWLHLGGSLSAQTLLLFLFLALAFYQPLLALGELLAFERIVANAVRNMAEFLRAPTLPEPQQPQHGHGSTIAFDNVGFGYDDRPVLQHLSFRTPEHGVTALVGPSGAGKTTVANLLARFWDVDEGAISIGGVDVRAMRSDDLQAQITMVFQDVYLFHDTLRANIALGKPGASDAEIEAAARAARCHDFIAALPEGYNTLVGEGGATLSGGEKQRVSIARALLKDAPIVLLDEATASVDPENEWLIQQAIDALAANKTVVVIAHRLATLKRADQILVLQAGKLVQQGRHAELIAQEGLYRRFWQQRQRAQGWKLAPEREVRH